MFLAADDTRRMTGLIWLDEAMSARPAAHVLIIGIGAYKSPKFKQTLTSTTISARAVADWFIDQGKAGFKNPSAPLGSVALLLSEPQTADGSDHAIYAGGTVPRATFSEAYTAVRDWVRRINTHKDNFAFLYVASHGESYLGRTAILLEDYGLDDLNATSGMSEVEQFVTALENAIPIHQLLLFDCCRTPTDIHLPRREQLGNKLISLTRRDDDHGQTRKQCFVLATAIDKAALGQAGNVTLFADALLQALDGVASDTTQPNWPVRPANLIDKINELLELYRLPGEAQIAPGTTNGTFNVSVPGEQPHVPMYLSLEDPADWPDSVINVAASPGEKFTIKGVEGEPPFSKIIVPLMAEVTVEARARHGDEIGTATRKAYGPAVFLKISKVPKDAGTVVGTLDEKRSVKPRARIDIDLRSYVHVEAGAVAGIVRHDDPGNDPKLISVPLAGVASQEVGPGAYGVSLWTPDGQVHKRAARRGSLQPFVRRSGRSEGQFEYLIRLDHDIASFETFTRQSENGRWEAVTKINSLLRRRRANVSEGVSAAAQQCDYCAMRNTPFHFMLVAALVTMPNCFNLRQKAPPRSVAVLLLGLMATVSVKFTC